MKYEKPEINVKNISLNKPIANTGLSTWLQGEGYSEAMGAITYYEVNS